MNRPIEVLRGAAIPIRERLSTITRQSERTFMLGTILVASAISAATGYVLAQCYSVDMLSSLLSLPEDCWGDWGMNIGRHCFGDYAVVVDAGMRPNPWQVFPLLPPNPPGLILYPAAGLVPQMTFGLLGKWLAAPRLGLVGYQLALTIAVLSPAVWAARGARGLERVVVFVALGAAAIPAWAVIDRGNSTGFVVPVALVFLVALCRRRWGLVAIMVVLAALVKPQFAILGVALLAARQWRMGGLSLAGVAISNLAAYLLWPRDFPGTITQSIHNALSYSGNSPLLTSMRNVSFGRALLFFPDTVKLSQTGGKVPESFLAGPRSLIGYFILALVAVSLLALGRRIPPVMVGIVLLATATFFPPVALFYYLVFVLPVAALVIRDPDGPPGTGIFDRLTALSGRRRAVGLCVSLAVALSIAQVAPSSPISNFAIPGQTETHRIVGTTVLLAPFLWLIACAVIMVSYARRPAPSHGSARESDGKGPSDSAISTSASATELMTESSRQGTS